MRNSFLLVISAIALGALLASCSGGSDYATVSVKFPKSEPNPRETTNCTAPMLFVTVYNEDNQQIDPNLYRINATLDPSPTASTLPSADPISFQVKKGRNMFIVKGVFALDETVATGLCNNRSLSHPWYSISGVTHANVTSDATISLNATANKTAIMADYSNYQVPPSVQFVDVALNFIANAGSGNSGYNRTTLKWAGIVMDPAYTTASYATTPGSTVHVSQLIPYALYHIRFDYSGGSSPPAECYTFVSPAGSLTEQVVTPVYESDVNVCN